MTAGVAVLTGLPLPGYCPEKKQPTESQPGPVHHDPSDTKRLNKTPGCLYKQAGFVTY